MTIKLSKGCIVILAFVSFGFLLTACSSGPEKALKETASAVKDKNVEKFKKYVDIPRLVRGASETAQREQREALAQAGSLFGSTTLPFGNILPNLSSKEIQMTAIEETEQQVASGRIILESKEKGLPWEPEALAKTEVEMVSDNSALAPVDSSKGLRTWLTLRRAEDGTWKITGLFDKRNDAEYWGSDQRLADITAKNEKLLAAWKEKTERINNGIKEWEELDSRCKDAKSAIQKEIAEIIDKVEIRESKIVFDEGNQTSSSVGLAVIKAKVNNRNDSSIKIKKVALSVLDNLGNKIIDSLEWIDSSNEVFLPGDVIEKEWAVKLNEVLTMDIQRELLAGAYSVVLVPNTIVIDGKLVDLNNSYVFSDLPKECNQGKPEFPRLPQKPDMLEY